jgi:hypothetical protein
MAADSSVVLITGAAGGLGQGLVEAFAAAGWRVAAGYHRTPCPRSDDVVWPVSLDVAAPERASEVVEGILARWGRLDALVNNAGVTADASVIRMSDEAWERVLEVNLKGAMACARAAVWPMVRQRDGHIINLCGVPGRDGGCLRTGLSARQPVVAMGLGRGIPARGTPGWAAWGLLSMGTMAPSCIAPLNRGLNRRRRGNEADPSGSTSSARRRRSPGARFFAALFRCVDIAGGFHNVEAARHHFELLTAFFERGRTRRFLTR